MTTESEIRETLAKYAAIVYGYPRLKNKKYVLSATYFSSLAEIDDELTKNGLTRRDQYIYDPAYPFKRGKAEELVGKVFGPVREPFGLRESFRLSPDHPFRAELTRWQWEVTPTVRSGDTMDGIWGDAV